MPRYIAIIPTTVRTVTKPISTKNTISDITLKYVRIYEPIDEMVE